MRQVSTPLEEWPPADLAAWRRATGPSDSLFGEASRAAEWSPATLRHRQEAVEVFVHFLRRQGHTDIPSVVPLVTPAVLDAFVADQRGRGNRGSTIAKRLESLHAALGLIAPSENFAFILRPGGLPLRRRLDTRPQPVEVHDTVDIIHRVQALHREGLNGIGYAGGLIARRDAALIGLVATRPERIRAVVAMRVGYHLVQRGTGWHLVFDAGDTKMGRDRDLPVPRWLLPIIEDYLYKVRPALGGANTDGFWVSTWQGGASYNTLGGVFRRRTTAWFGRGRGPHWLRKCFTTTLVEYDPELALDAAVICDHSPQVALDHYNKAKPISAGHRHNSRVDKLKEQTRHLAERAFAGRLRRPA